MDGRVIIQAINNTSSLITYLASGVTIPANGTATVPNSALTLFIVDAAIDLKTCNVSLNDTNFTYVGIGAFDFLNDIIDLYLRTSPQPIIVQAAPAFAAKTFGTKSLYKRITGTQQSLTIGSNAILFVIPYNWVKINGLEVIGAETNDTVSMYILDSTTGTYTGISNYQLNQFGFSVNLAKDYYAYKSEFDADLYINMQIKIVYTSASVKTIGINFILNEVK